MLRGIYTACSGLISQNKTLDTAGSNIANARTAGYKSARLVTGTFGEEMESRLDVPQGEMIGKMTLGRQPDRVYTSFQQGVLEETGRAYDFAIAGDGFFTVEDASGRRAFTRNGAFTLDQAGYLCTAGGMRVLGEKGPIQVKNAELKIHEDGDISLNGKVTDRLRIYLPADVKSMAAAGEGLFQDTTPGRGGQFTGKIIQGSIEGSNVDMAKEMTAMMAASRGFQSCSQVIKMLDQISEKTVTEIGRL